MPRRATATHQPAYAGDDRQQQPLNSRHNPPQDLHRRGQDQHYSASQVDSWRSYRNDTTNLQQTAGYADIWAQKHTQQQVYHQPLQQSDQYYNAYGLNPTASTFTPINYNPLVNPAQSFFTPYQPLRVSNGQQERHTIDQTRFYSSVADEGNHQQLTFQYRGLSDSTATLHGNPPFRTEQHRQASSSVPKNLKSSVPHRPSPSASPPPAPSPTRHYLVQAALEPVSLKTPQKLLVVLDLNGTLLKRSQARGSNFVLRPGVVEFVEYLFANHAVMVYSSARPENVKAMVVKLLSPLQRNQLVAVWARDKLELNREQYLSKVQVYKKLDKIWADQDIQNQAEKGCRWDQTNTVLVDDSHLKALAQPHNLLGVEEFLNDCPSNNNGGRVTRSKAQSGAVGAWNDQQRQIINDLELKLEVLKYTTDVSRLIRRWQSVDKMQTVSANNQSVEAEQTQLLTPKSPVDISDSDSDGSDGGVEHGLSAHELNNTIDGGDRDGSISPVNDAVWAEILGGLGSQSLESSRK